MTSHLSCVTNSLPPTELLPWLNIEGSLTALLEVKAGQPLRVERQFEGYRLLSLAQKKQLGIKGAALSHPRLAWVREVYLYGNDELPWVQAQSLFPLSSLKGSARRLQQLKSTPIGYVLFNPVVPCPISALSNIRQMAGNGRRFMIGMVVLYLLVRPFCHGSVKNNWIFKYFIKKLKQPIN